MKSKVASSSTCRAKSLRKTLAPLSTPTKMMGWPAKSWVICAPNSATRLAICSRLKRMGSWGMRGIFLSRLEAAVKSRDCGTAQCRPAEFACVFRRRIEFQVCESTGGTPMPMPEFQQLCNEAKKEVREINVDDLQRMQQAGEKFALIDVREPDETAKGTIPGAIPIPRGVLELKIDQVTTDKDAKIVLYCVGG